jgi:hypothetical protein
VGGGTYVVERAELGGVLVQAGVGREDGSATLTLVANYPTHGDGVVVSRRLSWEVSRSKFSDAHFDLLSELLVVRGGASPKTIPALCLCVALAEHQNIKRRHPFCCDVLSNMLQCGIV